MSLSQKLGGKLDEFLLLVPMHGVDRSSKLRGSSGLDFNKHEHATILGDKVELSEGRADIFRNDAIAFPPQVALGLRLSFLPKDSPGVKNCHALVRCIGAARRGEEHGVLAQVLPPPAHRSADE